MKLKGTQGLNCDCYSHAYWSLWMKILPTPAQQRRLDEFEDEEIAEDFDEDSEDETKE